MPNYRRSFAGGAAYFFTVNLADRSSDVLTAHIADLRAAVRLVHQARPFSIDAMVVLPDHLHAVWTLPEGDADFSTRWGAIKARFTRNLRDGCRMGFHPTNAMRSGHAVGWNPTLRRSDSKARKGDAGIWQRRFWEHRIRGDADFRAHVTYCWGNPVKHGYVEKATDWPYSSIHRDIRLGRVPTERGAPVEGRFGE